MDVIFGWTLVVGSLLVGVYSLASRYLPFALPNFPFYSYILIHVLVFFSIPKRFVFPFIALVLVNFAFPGFRNTFFSHFGSPTWMFLITLLFVLSGYGECILILRVLLGSTTASSPGRILFSVFLTMVLYLGIVSPFYLGVVKPGPYKSTRGASDEGYRYDKVYEEKVITEKTADREAGRRYFVDGKMWASKGCRSAFVKSIEIYTRATELIPRFSSAYAEIAYSYASIAKILREANGSVKQIEENEHKARETADKAEKINPDNPHLWGVKAILNYYSGNQKEAESSLQKARKLAEKQGYTDRVLQAMSYLAINRVEKVSYQLAIKEIKPDDAEVLNLLGLGYYETNNLEAARKAFERAKNLSTGFGKPYLNLGLVHASKEYPALCREASDKDDDIKQLSGYYANLYEWTRWLWRFYVGLFILFILRFLLLALKYANQETQQISAEGFQKIRRLCRGFAITFLSTYCVFEVYVHVIRPMNGVDHMFPVSFPFF